MASSVKKAINSFVRRSLGRVNGGRVGYLDARANGRFNAENGELVPGFKITSADTVADIGCGDGGMCMFAAAAGAEVLAADIDAGAIARTAKKLARSKARGYKTYVSDSDPLPIADSTATRVITSEVMEHVPDPAQFLSELVRIGKPNALYLITVPGETGENLQKTLAPPAYWAPPNHVRIFTEDSLAKVINDAGLTIERRTNSSFFWTIWWMLFWAEGRDLNEPEGPILSHWSQTWNALLATPKGDVVRQTLDEFMPKSQVVVARKAA